MTHNRDTCPTLSRNGALICSLIMERVFANLTCKKHRTALPNWYISKPSVFRRREMLATPTHLVNPAFCNSVWSAAFSWALYTLDTSIYVKCIWCSTYLQQIEVVFERLRDEDINLVWDTTTGYQLRQNKTNKNVTEPHEWLDHLHLHLHVIQPFQ